MNEFERKHQDEHQKKKLDAYIIRRSLMDFGMGLIYFALGGFFVFAKQLGYELRFPQPPFSYIFGGLCLVYGAFRFYRGYRKNYTN
ncbi:MAG: hypothetical protein ABW036_14000 [Flavitalea sp.]